MLLRKLVLPLTVCCALAACQSDEERAAEHFESGLALIAEGDLQRASVEFRNVLKYDNNNAEARRQIAAIALDNGEFRVAYRNYTRVVEQIPDDAESRLILSEIAFETSSWESFDHHAPEAIRLNEGIPRARILAVATDYRNALLSNDDPARDEAISQAETLSTALPDDRGILRKILIDGYIGQQRFDAALTQLEDEIEANPENRSLYQSRLQILARQGDTPGLEAELRRIIERFPEDQDSKDDLLRFLLAQQRTDDAQAFLREIIENSLPEDVAENYKTLISFILQTEGPAAALAEIETGLSETPQNVSLRALRASIRFDLGATEESITELQDILSDETAALPVLERQRISVLLAKMLESTGNEVGARKLVEEILAEDQNAVEALKIKSRWLIRSDDTDASISNLRIALDQSPQDTEAMTLMAAAYERAGNRELMLNFLSLAVEASKSGVTESLRYAEALANDDRLQQAETTLIAALRQTPGNLQILSALGSIYMTQEDEGRLAQVISALKRSGTGAASAEAARLEVTQLSRNATDSSEVLQYLENLRDLNEENIGIKLAIIRTHLENDEMADAVEKSQALKNENLENSSLTYFHGLTLASAGEFEKAEEIFAELTQTYPEAEAPWMQLTRIQGITSGDETVLATLDNGLAALPKSANLLWAKASKMQQANRIDEAIEIYEQLYENDSSKTIIANNLASLLSTFRQDETSLDRARVIARRLRGTEIPEFQDTYGWIMTRTGNASEGLSYLEPAAQALQQDASVQYHLGVAYAELEQYEEAQGALRRAMEQIGPMGSIRLQNDVRQKLDEVNQALQSQ